MSIDEPTQSPADKFKSQLEDKRAPLEPETSIWKGSYSPKAMMGSWILAAIISIAALLILWLTPLGQQRILWWVFLFALLAGWCYLIGLMLYRKFSMFYELTSQRLRHREGLFFRQLDRIELLHIDDVTYSQGPVQAILNVGTIKVKSSDVTHPVLTMYGIADVRTVADAIDNARRTERRKRAMHIESI
ncbi:MAG TPA: PH domain-containing protein [Pirellulaceae bacterium]|nr:PH domain-containing protein [Pirellulaceae bacterium]HMO90934.1 PH domain-containing protein [Pirellulaceae bacterium]HMP69833.1 PH domain-containing protein [Pirellulaceae bacterium]